MPGSLLPEYEQPFWSQGKLVAGVDDVGRGDTVDPLLQPAQQWRDARKFAIS